MAQFADCEEISASTIPPDFARNPRMAMPYKAWAKMDEGERAATLAQAMDYLGKLDAL